MAGRLFGQAREFRVLEGGGGGGGDGRRKSAGLRRGWSAGAAVADEGGLLLCASGFIGAALGALYSGRLLIHSKENALDSGGRFLSSSSLVMSSLGNAVVVPVTEGHRRQTVLRKSNTNTWHLRRIVFLSEPIAPSDLSLAVEHCLLPKVIDEVALDRADVLVVWMDPCMDGSLARTHYIQQRHQGTRDKCGNCRVFLSGEASAGIALSGLQQ